MLFNAEWSPNGFIAILRVAINDKKYILKKSATQICLEELKEGDQKLTLKFEPVVRDDDTLGDDDRVPSMMMIEG